MKKKQSNSALSCSLIRRPIQRWGWLFLLPTFAAFCVGFLYPFAKGLFLSFCKFKTTSKWTWVGLKNYQTIFQDEGFLHAFWYTALFALASLLIINVLAFAVAYALTQGIKGIAFVSARRALRHSSVFFCGQRMVPSACSDCSPGHSARFSRNTKFS